MLKNSLKFEFKIADRIYHFLCDNDSPIEHVKEAIFQISKAVGQIEDNIKSQQEQMAQKEEQSKIEPIAEQKVE